jgi:hypothetical protein
MDEPRGRISVLSISRHLTVWRNQDIVSWRTPDGYQRHELCDLVDLAEQIICVHENLARPGSGH